MLKSQFSLKNICILPIFFIAILTIHGFDKPKKAPDFPAPLKDSIVAIYYDFESSNLYETNSVSSNTIKLLANEIHNRYNTGLSTEKTTNLLYEILSVKPLKLSKLYFYFSNERDFVFILEGKFPWNHISKKIQTNAIINRNNGFSCSLKAPCIKGGRLSVNIYSNFILVCPENISGNVMQAYLSKEYLLNDNFTVFKKMVKKKPAFSFESDAKELIDILAHSNFAITQELKQIHHIRLILHPKIYKLQLSVENTDKVQAIAKSLLRLSKNFNAKSSSSDIKIKNKSIYLSYKASRAITKEVSIKIASFLLQHLVRESNKIILLSKIRKAP